jgi:hypothetical protein
MKTCGGRKGPAPPILNLGIRWKLVINLMRRQIYPREINIQYALNRKKRQSQGRYALCGEEEHTHTHTQAMENGAV